MFEMFYFTCNESIIYESFTFWNKLQEKKLLFHDILIYWDAPVCVCVYIYTHTAGKISIEHITIFLSKYISNGAVDLKFSPDVDNNPSNP